MCAHWLSAVGVICAVFSLTATPVKAQEQRPQSAELLSSAEAVQRVGQLMREHRWEEALEVARSARLDTGTRESLIGLIALRTGNHQEAVQAFRAALREQPDRELLHLYMGWSLHALGRYTEADAALTQVRSDEAQIPSWWLLRGRLARDLGQPEEAYVMLQEGRRRYPKHLDLTRELGLTLVEFGGVQQARPMLLAVLTGRASEEAIWQDAVRLLKALADLGHEREALLYTEVVRARLPSRAALLDATAAHLHARRGEPLAAARLFVRATQRGGEAYHFEAADQYRMARRTRAALRWNARVVDRRRRSRQRFMILVEGGRWARAAHVGAQLATLGSMDSPALRYRWGLALIYGAGDLEAAQEQLRHLG
ncbi:MAG: tetratricopeptide repeat protein, partial [Myxococcota bacterium]